jgi:perosamine synthetase
MSNGDAVRAFEAAFAEYVGARYAIALCNGTATLHTALVALGVKPGDRVAVPPLTMASTTIAVLHAGAVPVFCDVDPQTWLMRPPTASVVQMPVSLYGLHWPGQPDNDIPFGLINDAAQTLMPFKRWRHRPAVFQSYSFQASKILALGEGGMLVTDTEELATRAREFSSLGYRMRADQPRIDPAVLKHPRYERHHSLGWNYRMSDLVASHGLSVMRETLEVKIPGYDAYTLHDGIDGLLTARQRAASLYRDAIAGCSWLTPQHVPEGWTHDYWTYAVAFDAAAFEEGGTFRMAKWLRDSSFWVTFANLIEKHGGERPYAAWRLTYQEPFISQDMMPYSEQLDDMWTWKTDGTFGIKDGLCPVAEDLQPRLMQFQTNDLASAERNAAALAKAIRQVEG